jgi:hypothetical protein
LSKREPPTCSGISAVRGSSWSAIISPRSRDQPNLCRDGRPLRHRDPRGTAEAAKGQDQG